MRAHGIDQLRALAHRQIPRPVQRQKRAVAGLGREACSPLRAFRTLKGIDLQVRPIRREARVKAHIFLSKLAYYVQWHMIEAWAPLTFKDEAGADAARLADLVAPARRSQAALAKVHTRTLADGTPAMSFTPPARASGHHCAQYAAAQEGAPGEAPPSPPPRLRRSSSRPST